MKKRALFRAGLIWRIFCINSKQEIKRVHKKEIIIIKKIKAIVYKKIYIPKYNNKNKHLLNYLNKIRVIREGWRVNHKDFSLNKVSISFYI